MRLAPSLASEYTTLKQTKFVYFIGPWLNALHGDDDVSVDARNGEEWEQHEEVEDVFFPEVFDVRVARHRVHLQPVRDELDRDRQLGRIFFKLFHRNKKLPIFWG